MIIKSALQSVPLRHEVPMNACPHPPVMVIHDPPLTPSVVWLILTMEAPFHSHIESRCMSINGLPGVSFGPMMSLEAMALTFSLAGAATEQQPPEKDGKGCRPPHPSVGVQKGLKRPLSPASTSERWRAKCWQV